MRSGGGKPTDAEATSCCLTGVSPAQCAFKKKVLNHTQHTHTHTHNNNNKVCVMIHSGSRGLGHQVATDALVEMERAMARDGIAVNDRQLACARISSKEGQCVVLFVVGCVC